MGSVNSLTKALKQVAKDPGKNVDPALNNVQALVKQADYLAMNDKYVDGRKALDNLIDSQDDRFEWPDLDENDASSMCYTSGTTGRPKGVVYSHRSTVLHSLAAALPDALNVSARDVILPVVPMFHVNAWGLPYVAPMVGCKVVLPGPNLDGKSLYELFEAEKVTCSAGVPTVWQGLLAHTEASNLRFSTMNRTVIG